LKYHFKDKIDNILMMLRTIKDTNDTYILLNNIVKIDIDQAFAIKELKNAQPENFFFDEKNKLWYYKNYKTNNKLIDIFYPEEKVKEVIFKNDDVNDYRNNNLKLISKINNNIFKEPSNVEILLKGNFITITEGKYAKQTRNMYWQVKDKDQSYYMIHLKDDLYTKISNKDINKVLSYKNIRPIWYLMSSTGYIATTIRIGDDSRIIYLHQYIMNTHDKDNTDYKETVDHINRDKLDNRQENLRIINMSEQNKNKDKQTRRKDACDLPPGIKSLPKYIQYRKEIYDKENNSSREFFIVSHPKLDKDWDTAKSSKLTLQEKLNQAELKIKEIEGDISTEEFNELTGKNNKIDLPIGITLDIKREKYHYILDLKRKDIRYNAKMVLHSTNVQKELDNFIENVINVKYPNLFIKYKIKNPIEIDDKLISHEIQIDKELKPTYPPYITVYEEKGTMYIQFMRRNKDGNYNKKNKILSNNIQNELDKLVKEVNEKYPGYNLEKLTVINPELFKGLIETKIIEL
jgi:hypothetical protein